MRVHLDLEFLGGAAPTVDGGDAGNGQQPARHDPILNRAQIGDSEMLRTDHLVTIDFPGRAVRLDCGHQTARQADVLLHRDRCLGVGEVVVHPVFEDDANKGQSIERGRADDVDAGRRVETNLHGARVVTFHLLGREARRLRGDFQDDRRGIRIRLDIEHLEGNEPGAGKQQQTQHHNRAAAEAKCDERFEHGGSSFTETEDGINLIGWWRRQHVAQKHGAVRHGQFSALQAIENLNPVVASQADLDDSLHKTVAIGRHPSRHRAIGFADHAIRRYGGGFHRVVDANDEVSEHSGTQLIVGVRDLGTDRDSMSIRINRLVDLGNLALEHAVRIGHHLDLNRLAQVKKRISLSLTFASIHLIDTSATE